MHVQPTSGTLGAVVDGVDLEKLDDDTFELIHAALLENLVLFFRAQQDLTLGGQASFAERFGELEKRPMTEKLDDAHPEVTLLHSDKGGRADVWHSDFTYAANPMMGAVLRYVSGPKTGGDTMWSNQYAAYETLSAPLQDMLTGLTAIHAAIPGQRMELEAEHPIVRTHPETGRRSLYVNRLYTTRIPQLQAIESQGLLAMLFAWVERPEFTCRWTWQEGDVAIWDNRCTMHYAIGDYSEPRVLHRVAILGDPPVGDEPRWDHHDHVYSAASSSHVRRR